jgi:hypothetical protein
VVDAFGMVDEDAETRRCKQLDREDVDARQVVLDPRCDLALELAFLLERRRNGASSSQKMGPQAHFRTAEMWCGQCS